MTTRYQQNLAFLHDPSRVTLRTEEERQAPWEEEHARMVKLKFPPWRMKDPAKERPTPRTPEDVEAPLDRLARRPADYYQTDTNPHKDDAFRADLLVKAMDRPDYWTPESAAKRLAAYRAPVE